MKKFNLLYLFVFAIIVTQLVASDLFIESFTANSDGKNITIRWRTTSEDNLNSFALERSNNNSYFKQIYEADSKGMPSYYSFVDEEAFMKEIALESSKNEDQLLSENNYTYRLKVIKSDNTFLYTDAISVAHNPSSIRRTWGMIKEMFK